MDATWTDAYKGLAFGLFDSLNNTTDENRKTEWISTLPKKKQQIKQGKEQKHQGPCTKEQQP